MHYNKLIKMDQMDLLDEVLKLKFQVIISGVFAEPLDASYLGKTLNKKMVYDLGKAEVSHGINPAGEGGEIETTVLWAPGFKSEILVKKAHGEYLNNSGVYTIDYAELK